MNEADDDVLNVAMTVIRCQLQYLLRLSYLLGYVANKKSLFGTCKLIHSCELSIGLAVLVWFHWRVFGRSGNGGKQFLDDTAQVVSVARAGMRDHAKISLHFGSGLPPNS